jgi:dinuclear metal center YbgI/SA1388 family protein
MSTIADVVEFLESFAPTSLAEEWDNVGLLVGDAARPVRRLMTCLTVTPASAREAIRENADLIVSHHPLPFRPLKRLTMADHEGRLLWQLIGAGISIYSPHTAFDSAVHGINARLAEGLRLVDVQPLVPQLAGPGAGRYGNLESAQNLASVAARAKALLRCDIVQLVGERNAPVSRVAVACGSGGEFLSAAVQAGCDCLLTGEARFHTCLEAEARGLALILAGHYATERFGIEVLAELLAQQFADVHSWASRDERDPIALL